MIGILIIAHAPLGSAFKTVIQHIFESRLEDLEVIDVLPNQDRGDVIELANAAVTRLNSGNGVLVLTDIAGATPSVCCQQLNASNKIGAQLAILAGLSLPMLLRVLTYRNKPLETVVEIALAGAQNGATRIETYSPTSPYFITPTL